MEEEIPKEQICESRDDIIITCGDIIAFGYTLTEAIEKFDSKLKHR